MKLEPIIQNEVGQKEKHLYSIFMHIYGIRKTVMATLYADSKNTDVKNRLLDSVGESKGGNI